MTVIKDYFSNEIELEYSKNTPISHRKKYAQFFTPYPIAELMAKWLLGNSGLKTVLDPAFGLGIFSRALFGFKHDLNVKGFDIDANIFDEAQKLFKDNNNIRIYNEDYMYNDWENRYDGIICNPPYLKFHDYDNKNIIKDIEDKILWKLNGFTNLYTLFLLKSIYQLNPDGRAAYIIPSEFLNSDYGKLVKSYIIKNKSLRHVIIIDFEENVFEDALTTASILLFAKDNKSNEVRFTNVKNLSDLNQIEKLIQQYPSTNGEKSITFDQINPKVKWRSYYQLQNSVKYKHLTQFSNLGKVVRGIATGANSYFTFNLSKAKTFDIDRKYLLPCICKSNDVKSSFFTNDDFEELQNNDKLVFLLNAKAPLDTHVEKYLEKGIHEGIHKRYLTASRNPWYSLENRQPAPIWVSVFNRNGPRFIRNEANISNLTTFHCIYPNTFSGINADLFFAYLLTAVSREIFEDNRREYGNGLKKFEPNDINKAKMLDLDYIDPISEQKILELYKHYRKSEFEKKPDEKILREINEIFITRYS